MEIIMSQKVELAQFQLWLQQYAERIEQQENYLTELDTVIGDADHGANMQRGMIQVRRQLDRTNNGDAKTVSAFLRSTAMTLISSVGGAAGPLYGAFFLRAAKDAGNSDAVELDQLARMFRDGLEGVKQRGKANVEEKTMIDVLEPAVEALEETAASGGSLDEALDAACFAARAGMLHTIDLEAQKGRASYLGPRSIGHQDPGATSTYYLIETAAGALGSDDHRAPRSVVDGERDG
jgi:dihydroxyacetone kinase-like protein